MFILNLFFHFYLDTCSYYCILNACSNRPRPVAVASMGDLISGCKMSDVCCTISDVSLHQISRCPAPARGRADSCGGGDTGTAAGAGGPYELDALRQTCSAHSGASCCLTEHMPFRPLSFRRIRYRAPAVPDRRQGARMRGAESPDSILVSHALLCWWASPLPMRRVRAFRRSVPGRRRRRRALHHQGAGSLSQTRGGCQMLLIRPDGGCCGGGAEQACQPRERPYQTQQLGRMQAAGVHPNRPRRRCHQAGLHPPGVVQYLSHRRPNG